MFKRENKMKKEATTGDKVKVPFYKKLWFKVIAGMYLVLLAIWTLVYAINPDLLESTEPEPIKPTAKPKVEVTETEKVISVTDEDIALYEAIEREYIRLYDLAIAEVADGEILTGDDDERLWEEARINIANEKGLSIEEINNFYDTRASDVIEKQVQDQKAYTETAKGFDEVDGLIKAVAKKFAEKQEMKKLKFGILDSKINYKRYSNSPIHDQAGNKYPYSFLVVGEYEDKQGNLGNAIMVIAFDSPEQAKDLEGYLLLYVCQETGVYFNVLADADNQFLE